MAATAMRCETVNLQVAVTAVNASQAKANGLGVRENIAVVDRGGNLKAFARMDDA